MNLTIILPNISNKELIIKLNKEKRIEDELICFKNSSTIFNKLLNNEIYTANYDNILLLNYVDHNILYNKNILDMFRTENTVITNLKENNKISKISSIKFNRKNIKLPDEEIRNLIDYIKKIFYDLNDFTQLNTKNILKKTNITKNSQQKDDFFTVNFWGRNNLYENKGPYIQSINKMKYFKRDIDSIKFLFENYTKKAHWNHYLFPNEIPPNTHNYSYGPNIFLTKKLHEKHKNKYIVADSEFMKEYLIEHFNLPENNIYIIPVYISSKFFEIKLQRNKEFIIGLTGYYQNNDIKNFSSLPYIANALSSYRFEILSSRSPKTFPREIRELENAHFLNVRNDMVPEIMKKWSIYLSMSKRERGPAATQEAKVTGIPIITPDHTGYREFNNCILLPIKPYKEHTNMDKDLIISAIQHCFENYEKYSSQCLHESRIFWEKEKNPLIISKKWENFFLDCITQY